jgi:formate dehydrogenase subunit delta
MSHDTETLTPHAKLITMANQIAKFMESKPHQEGLEGLSSHINDFWEPRMRRHLFDLLDAGGQGLRPLVIEATPLIRRPAAA